jgi:adenylate cyclase
MWGAEHDRGLAACHPNEIATKSCQNNLWHETDRPAQMANHGDATGGIMGTAAAEAVYRFDGFVLDLMRGVLLTTSGKEVQLRNKAFRLLCLFLENAGCLLDRSAINQTIWPDVTVSDDGITQCVGDIRRALSDDTQAIIKTVPRRGYIFAANVNVARDKPAGETFRSPIRLPDKPSIAILPSLNLSAVSEWPPDGICATRAVRHYVQDRRDLALQELATLDLNNIVRPVEAFVRKLDSAGSTRGSAEWYFVDNTRERLAPPDRPSIAVLPFTNMSGDPDQEFFSDGITEDIITELSRTRWLIVIARNSSFTYKGQPIAVKRVAGEPGARYVLEGSVRRSGERLRVSARLIDTEAGSHIWAERYDRRLTDVFAVQDEITTAATNAIHPALTDAELRRSLRRPVENLSAWEAYQRGLWYTSKSNLPDHERAQAFFKLAIALDPEFAPGYAALARAFLVASLEYSSLPLAEAMKAAGNWARRAIDVDPGDADSHAALAHVMWLAGDNAGALEHVSIALAGNPNSPWANLVNGFALASNGNLHEGRDALLTALRLNPRDQTNKITVRQIAPTYYFERNYLSAVDAARGAISLDPEFSSPYRWLAAALGQLGRIDEARCALNSAIGTSHQSFALYVRSRPPWFSPEYHEHMLDGLRKAGWQD